MSCLQWILALTLLHYLTAAPTRVLNPRDLNQDGIFTKIEKLNQTNCRVNDSQFYSVSFVQSECIDKALECAMEELKVVANECFKDEKPSYKLCLQMREFINKTLTKRSSRSTAQATPISAKCNECELNKQKPFKKFLEDLKTLLQMSNIM